MQAGTLRKVITLQARSTMQDALGQQLQTWADVATVRADIQPLSGRELLAAQAIRTEVSHRISLRYSSLLADPLKVAAMRVVYVNSGVTRYFNVAAAMNLDERNKQVDMMAYEGLNDG